MHSSVQTSRVTIPDPEISEYPWSLVVSPRSKLVKNMESENHNGFSFAGLQFNNGFLTEVDHKWGFVLESTQIKLFMALPKRTETHSYAVIDSRIQLVSKNKTLSEYSTHFYKDEFASAPLMMWRALWNISDESWNDSIDEIRIILKVQRQAKGICDFSLYSPEVIDKTRQVLNSVGKEVDCKELFLSEHLSDIILECKGEKFHAHRFILACRSSVFKKMFQVGLKEVAEGRILIEDIEPDVLKELLRFMYFSEVESVDEIYMQLFAAADKYDIRPLKIICEKEIEKKIDVENALNVYVMSEMHSSIILQEKALEVVLKNKKEIFRDREVRKMFAARCPDAAFKIFCNL